MTRGDVIRGANGFPAITVDLRRPEDPSAACTPTDSSNTPEEPVPTSDYTALTWWGSIAMFFGDVLARASALAIGGFVEFAYRISFSRLWLLSTWLLAALAIPLVRVIGRTLTTSGTWVIKAATGGLRCHGAAVKESLGGDADLRRGPLTVYADDPNGSVGMRLDKLMTDIVAHQVILVRWGGDMYDLDVMINALNVRMIPYAVVALMHNPARLVR
jgi:hypothetical protein